MGPDGNGLQNSYTWGALDYRIAGNFRGGKSFCSRERQNGNLAHENLDASKTSHGQ